MNEELYDEHLKEWAKDIYTKEDLTAGDIALKIGSDEATVAKWAYDGGWYGIRRSLLTSKRSQLEYVYDALENLRKKNRDERAIKDADQFLRYSGTIKNLETQTSVSEIIEVFELFILWMRRRDMKLTKKLITHLDAFVQMRINA